VSTRLLVRYPGRPVRSRIVIGRGELARLGRFVRAVSGARRVALITDPRVARLHAPAATASLRRGGVEVGCIVVRHGESAKTPLELAKVWSRLARLGLTRRDAIVALGGGVVGDLAGFAAATWLRGVPWIGVPTTVLAQVDSSVGGKTAIDLDSGKNLAGAFHQPAGVLIDPDLLRTLPARQRRAGLAEVVKMGMTVDASLFRWVERHRIALAAGHPRLLAQAVERAVRVKLRVVRRDEHEREGGPRTALNYGHTLAHALEVAARYRGLLHGEAVAVGMRAAARLSERVVGLPVAHRQRQDAVLDALRLPRRIPGVRIDGLRRAFAMDKKRDGSKVRWVLTPRMGHASVPRPIQKRLVEAILVQLGGRVR